ncbi:KR domain-containing protein [Streptomyces rimosus]|uniref:KR domain-containing protein n=1 Tax=Streptomyces rimosus TaxID=1927 RepID=UPI0004CB9720|nr:KR domain-containing protein [Streptomyces rimosus]
MAEPAPVPTSHFRLFTPTAVPAEPWAGAPWTGVSVLVAEAAAGPLAGELARELALAGARVQALDVVELTGRRTDGTAPVPRQARALTEPAGPRWLVWVSAHGGTGQAPLSSADGARTLAELACLRALVKELAEGWERHGPGGLLLVTAADGRSGGSRAGPDPAGGALAGFARALGDEYPSVATLLVDAGRGPHLSAARRIALMGRPSSGQHALGLSAGGCWTTRLTALPLTDHGQDASTPGLLDALREPGAAILVSGGTTGIVGDALGAAAERLSGPLPGKLVLLERAPHVPERRRHHPSRPPAARSALPRLRGTGVTVDHEVIDICDVRAMRALGEWLGLLGLTVRTVLHGTGSGHPFKLTEKPADAWENTAAARIAGFHNLLDAAGDGLRLAVVHGSASAGLPGRTDSASGDEYLATAVARLRAERRDVTAQCVAWPVRDHTGTDELPYTQRLESTGPWNLDPDQGARWATAITAQARTLPAHVVLLPVPLTGQAAVGCAPVERGVPWTR